MGGNAQPGAPSLTNANIPQGGGLRLGQSAFPGGAGFAGVGGPVTSIPQGGQPATPAPPAPQMPQGAPNYAALAGGRMPGVGGPPIGGQVPGGMPTSMGAPPPFAQALQGMFGRR